jgi:putative Holliday junction resolvase
MGRVLAFDYGRKRVGVAVTDPLKIIANTLDTVPNRFIFDFIKKYCTSEDVECFVVGFPYAHGHNENPVAIDIERFVGKLKEMYPDKPIHKIDESFTSKIASQTLLLSGVNKKERQNKGNIDAISANLILQTYLQLKGS